MPVEASGPFGRKCQRDGAGQPFSEGSASAVVVVTGRCDNACSAADPRDGRFGARAPAAVDDVRAGVAHARRSAAIEAGTVPVAASRTIGGVADVVVTRRLVVALLGAIAPVAGDGTCAAAAVEMIRGGVGHPRLVPAVSTRAVPVGPGRTGRASCDAGLAARARRAGRAGSARSAASVRATGLAAAIRRAGRRHTSAARPADLPGRTAEEEAARHTFLRGRAAAALLRAGAPGTGRLIRARAALVVVRAAAEGGAELGCRSTGGVRAVGVGMTAAGSGAIARLESGARGIPPSGRDHAHVNSRRQCVRPVATARDIGIPSRARAGISLVAIGPTLQANGCPSVVGVPDDEPPIVCLASWVLQVVEPELLTTCRAAHALEMRLPHVSPSVGQRDEVGGDVQIGSVARQERLSRSATAVVIPERPLRPVEIVAKARAPVAAATAPAAAAAVPAGPPGIECGSAVRAQPEPPVIAVPGRG